MPKLYHHEGRWQVPGQQDRKATRMDLPASPEPLAAWLNDRSVPAIPIGVRGDDHAEVLFVAPQLADEPASDAPAKPSSRCGKCNSLLLHTEKAAVASAHSSMLACFSEWIDDAPAWAIDRLTEQLAERRQA